MANITYFDAYNSAETALTSNSLGLIVASDSSHIVIQYNAGAIDTFSGSFTYGANNAVFGVLTSVQETFMGAPSFTITGLSLSATPVANAILTGDNTTIVNTVFGGDDSITGSATGEPIEAGPGNDVVIALDGNDSIDGGAGNYDINGNKGEDFVFGGAGADTVRGGQGDDSVFGGDGDDGHVNGNIGDDSVSGGNGADTVYGGQGNDTISGDAGDDLLSGDLGNDIMYGGAGADRFTIAKGGGFDWVADFHASEGDKIQLAPGTTYVVTSIGGQVVIDLGNGDELGLAGIPAGSFSSDWIVFG